MIILLLLLEMALSQFCVDYELAVKCMDQCFAGQQPCIDQCDDDMCRYNCYSAQQDCINRCPCQAECSKGCHDCPHPICSCKNPSTLPDYQLCEDEVNSKLLECINNCGDDLACVSQCSRQFDQDFNQCPCNEDCPGGCPCPNYECTATTTTAAVTTTAQSSSSSVFILYSHKHSWEWKRPLVTDISGKADYNIWFTIEDVYTQGGAGAQGACSVTYKNQMLVFGGAKRHGDQISRIDECRLRRIGTIPFQFRVGGCAVSQGKIFLCFTEDDNESFDKENTCFAAQDDLNFEMLQEKSIFTHQDIRIGGSDDHVLAVGYRAKHAKAEVFGSSGWVAIDAYPFHPEIDSASIVHYQGAFYHIGGELVTPGSVVLSRTIAKLDVNFKWHQVGMLNRGRRSHAAIISDGFLLVIGGHDAVDTHMPAERCTLSEPMECFDQAPDLEEYQQFPELFNVPNDFCK